MVDISAQVATGRAFAAARMLAGFDQAELAELAGFSGSTISNVESGRDAREDTLKAIRKALRRAGVTVTNDKLNGLAVVALRYDEPDGDED